ncbi:RNA-binding protein 7 [Echinococcus granulosus]|uniref:Putative nucleotide binding protein n=1 Tax=Echinococcus granulosus TaxID=6210 RepID=A0A068WTH1_ECHGR|nr:RNA-binding protein 7 [Echinococcus granulosus]CDS21767.1 putative nucleotide binding protein [Echinococcus granulosus]
MEVDRTLYVSNIPPKATEILVYELFLQAGPVENVSLKDGYGFVTYEDEESVLYACSLFEGIRLYNYELKIKPRQGSKYENYPIKSYPPYTCLLSYSTNSPDESREFSHRPEYRYPNYNMDYVPRMQMTFTPTYSVPRLRNGRNCSYQTGYVPGPYSSPRDRSPLHRTHYKSGREFNEVSRNVRRSCYY